MRRIIVWWTFAGLIVPLLVLVIGQLQGGVFAWPSLALILWTSWTLNSAIFGRESTYFGMSVLFVSICIHGLLYAVVGIVLSSLFGKYIRKRT